jgi:hypothetical protein
VTGPDAAFATANPFVLKKVREAFAKGLAIGGRSTRSRSSRPTASPATRAPPRSPSS